ncbi:hypothetical protein IT570_01925 [Candidatus Sumerlaeota bacterium]|nr:hypothetical protein [Candidatus Sumerlaeota bacterium]
MYSFAEIEGMTEGRELLALLFMPVRLSGPKVELSRLLKNEALVAAPQSIQAVAKESFPWLLNQLQL